MKEPFVEECVGLKGRRGGIPSQVEHRSLKI